MNIGNERETPQTPDFLNEDEDQPSEMGNTTAAGREPSSPSQRSSGIESPDEANQLVILPRAKQPSMEEPVPREPLKAEEPDRGERSMPSSGVGAGADEPATGSLPHTQNEEVRQSTNAAANGRKSSTTSSSADIAVERTTEGLNNDWRSSDVVFFLLGPQSSGKSTLATAFLHDLHWYGLEPAGIPANAARLITIDGSERQITEASQVEVFNAGHAAEASALIEWDTVALPFRYRPPLRLHLYAFKGGVAQAAMLSNRGETLLDGIKAQFDKPAHARPHVVLLLCVSAAILLERESQRKQAVAAEHLVWWAKSFSEMHGVLRTRTHRPPEVGIVMTQMDRLFQRGIAGWGIDDRLRGASADLAASFLPYYLPGSEAPKARGAVALVRHARAAIASSPLAASWNTLIRNHLSGEAPPVYTTAAPVRGADAHPASVLVGQPFVASLNRLGLLSGF